MAETDSESNPSPDANEWTPGRGIVRAVAWSLVAEAVLSAALWPVGMYVPNLLFNWAFRAALAFLIAWMMFGVAQRAASFVGPSVTAIAIGATCLVLVSNHVVVALHGFPTALHGTISGWAWCDPRVLLFLNISSIVAIGFCTAIRHDGGGDLNTLGDIFSSRIT